MRYKKIFANAILLFSLSLATLTSLPQTPFYIPIVYSFNGENGEFGNWSWNGTNKILTIVANATAGAGDTEANAYGFQDIVNAIDYYGWSAQYNSSTSGTQFEFYFRIVIGNGSTTTWFADTLKQVSWGEGTLSANYQNLIEVTANAHFRSGILESEAKKTTSSGCSFFLKHSVYSTTYMIRVTSTTGEAHLYSSHFSRDGFYLYFSGENIRLWNCVLAKSSQIYAPPTSIDVFNTIINQAPSYAIYRPQGSYNKITITSSAYAVYLRPAGTMKNLFARDLSTAFLLCSFLSDDFNLIDADTDTWSIIWSGVNTGRVVRQYTFDLSVTDNAGIPIQNANVTIKHYGQGETQDYNGLTNSNGQIPTQTLTMGFYNQTGGNTIYDYNPYEITITHPSYATKTFRFSLEDKNTWTIALQSPITTKPAPVYDATYYLLGSATFLPILLLLLWERRGSKK